LINTFKKTTSTSITNTVSGKKRSTEHAILELSDRILQSIDSGSTPTTIFLDLTKAFDCLDHNILLHKLKHYNLNDHALQLCNNYLKNRKQYVMLDQNTQSDTLPINIGVPQGSILGPFFFLIYVNDLHHCSTRLKFITYADDTTLFTTLNPSDENTEIINNELCEVYQWLCTNKLSLNITKTNYMVFHTPHRTLVPPALKLNNIPLVHTDQFNFLGITLDKHMSWKPHTNKIATKIAQTCGILNKLKNTVPEHTLITLYQSPINPHINYGILAWGKSTNTSTLTKLQKRALRTITTSKYNAHTDPIHKRFNILKITDQYSLNALKFYYKYIHKEIPEYFTNFTLTNQQNSSHMHTRNSSQLAIPTHHSQLFKTSLRYSLVHIINNTPTIYLNRINTHSIQAFAHHIKNHIISNYQDACLIENCYVCGYGP
jgi:hypothetical protein